MSENADRPARSRPRIGSDGAADHIERSPASAAGRAGERTLPSNASRNIGTGRTNRKVKSRPP